MVRKLSMGLGPHVIRLRLSGCIAAALAHGVGSRFELWRSRVDGRRTAGHEGDAPAAMEEIVS
jgi:hypothetical protein